MDDIPDLTGHRLEQNYVKSTYDKIAEDFSSTRYKKWPKVDAFLGDLPADSLLLDVGCGNGKYLDNPTTYNIGCDLSLNLLKICKSRGYEVVLCDMSALPFRQEIFDSVICIAALHHVISSRRRQECLRSISNLMAPGSSKLLVQVWAFEQELIADNPYLKRKTQEASSAKPEDFEIDDDLRLSVHKNRTPFKDQDVLVPFYVKSKSTVARLDGPSEEQRQLRYYHVFKKGELDSMLQTIPGVSILESYYDKGNWCVIASKSENI